MAAEKEIPEPMARVVDGLGLEPEDAPGNSGEQSGDAAIAIGADHGGFPPKERIGFNLKQAGFTAHNCGTHTTEPVDYRHCAYAGARLGVDGTCTAGIVVDGAGIGSAMVANKVPGVQAAPCYHISSALNSREHNPDNVLTLGAGLIDDGLAWQMVEAWLATPWGESRHVLRVDKITDIERSYRSGS